MHEVMASGRGELAKHISTWLATLNQAADHESWGQPVEASELYKKLTKMIRIVLTSNIQISDASKRELGKLSGNLEHRAQLAADPTNVLESSQLSDIKLFLEDLQAGKKVTCQAVVNSPVKIQPSELVIDGDDDDDDDEDTYHNVQGNLLSQPLYKPGCTYLTIHVNKIGIKDPHNYIDPFIEISIKDSVTNNCEDIQQTPVSHCREITYFVYNVDVHVQTAIEDMPEGNVYINSGIRGPTNPFKYPKNFTIDYTYLPDKQRGAAIFFEFKHYKPKKERVSTRCFSFMELDEIRDGPISLEIYKKPTDFRRKKLFLLSVKPLYLHLKLLLNKPLAR